MKALNELCDLSGRSAIVTGGANGIGYGISFRLAEAGANVLIVDIDGEAAVKAAGNLHAECWAAEGFTADVSSEPDVQNMINRCQESFGSVDILVNNAGIYPPAPVEHMSEEDFDRVMRVNLRSCFLATKYAAEIMKKQQGGGKIINITSIDALHPSMVGLAHYDASKHGMWGFTKNSALELAPHNIQVNAIAPGGVTTPGVAAMQSAGPQLDEAAAQARSQAFIAKIPMHRMGEPDEIGKVTLFLASDMSSYMTGSQIVVDGGALLT